MENPNQVYIDSKWKFVLAISGGGQEAVGELTRHGGMSDTLLEAIVPYSLPAFYSLVRGKPDHIVSPWAARSAAMACYQRAVAYSQESNVFGFASTGAVVKVGGEREGRKHNVCMCLQMPDRTIGINLSYANGRFRTEEETLTSRCILQALRWGCHRFGDIQKLLNDADTLDVESYVAPPWMIELVHGNRNKYAVNLSNVVFASSCNPLHDGHLNIIRDASRRLGRKVDVELCVNNADKPSLDYLTIHERIEHATNSLRSIGASLVVTNKPMFFDKAELFPAATFVVGIDTFDRILDPTYYDDRQEGITHGLQNMESGGNRFLVYPRVGYNQDPFCFLNTYNKMLARRLSVVVSETEFTPSPLSSTELRRKYEHVNS